LLGYLLDRSRLIARVAVTQSDIDLVRSQLTRAEVRVAADVGEIHRVSTVRAMPGGVDELPSAALGSTGGGEIAVDPQDQNGTKLLERVFLFDLEEVPEGEGRRQGIGVGVVMGNDQYPPLAAHPFDQLPRPFP
jgi:putative peptide zinc metalloprotease protein